MRPIFLVYIFLLIPFCSFPQNKRLMDSLKAELKKELPDTTKVIVLNQLGRKYKYRNPDTSFILINEALELSLKIKWEKGVANSEHNIGGYNLNIGNYSEALKHYFKALEINKSIKNKIAPINARKISSRVVKCLSILRLYLLNNPFIF